MRDLTTAEFLTERKRFPVAEWRLVDLPALCVEIGPAKRPAGRCDFSAAIPADEFCLEALCEYVPQDIVSRYLAEVGLRFMPRGGPQRALAVLDRAKVDFDAALPLLSREFDNAAPVFYWATWLLSMARAGKVETTGVVRSGKTPLHPDRTGIPDPRAVVVSATVHADIAEANARLRAAARREPRSVLPAF